MSSDTPYTHVVDGGTGAPTVRTARWFRAFGLVSVVLATGLVVVTLWYSRSSQSAPEGVIFPEPTSLDHANELLLALPPTDPEKLYETHVSPHIAAMYKHFLEDLGSTAAGDKVHNLSSADFNQRLPTFEQNVKEIIRLNAESRTEMDSAVFAINLFADWTEAESRKLFGFRPEEGKQFEEPTKFLAPVESKTNLSDTLALAADEPDDNDYYYAFPSSVKPWNWASYYPTVFKIRQQGQCGSCWAHSTAEEIRQTYAAYYGQDVGKLSVQYLVDCVERTTCDDGKNGCCGGNAGKALQYIHDQGGIPLAKNYGEYTGGSSPFDDHPCRQVAPKVTAGQKQVKTETDMAIHLYNYGPIALSLAIDMKHWGPYSGGVLTTAKCKNKDMKKNGHHAVQLVGYIEGKKWIIQNSWGVGWGVKRTSPYHSSTTDAGFVLLRYGGNACDIKEYANIATKPKDVSRRRISRRRSPLK